MTDGIKQLGLSSDAVVSFGPNGLSHRYRVSLRSSTGEIKETMATISSRNGNAVYHFDDPLVLGAGEWQICRSVPE